MITEKDRKIGGFETVRKYENDEVIRQSHRAGVFRAVKDFNNQKGGQKRRKRQEKDKKQAQVDVKPLLFAE